MILAGYYLPGFKCGGPIRSLSNIIDRLGDEFEFKVITRDRDHGDTVAYANIESDRWHEVGKANVFYSSPSMLGVVSLRRTLSAEHYDVLYLTSFFSPHFSIKPILMRWLGLIRSGPVVLAPKGEFAPEALAISPYKKRAYIALFKCLRLHLGVIWQASSAFEERDIRKQFGAAPRVFVAANLPEAPCGVSEACASREVHRPLKLVFLGRISKMKNLAGALELLSRVSAAVDLDIYGPLEDRGYWAHCESIIARFPNNIRARYLGALTHDLIPAVLREHDVLFLPTLGENFGHVILEALSAGCPVLISDRTPWRKLETKGVGWDVPLERPDEFVRLIEKCAAMDQDEYMELRRSARRFYEAYQSDGVVLDHNRRLFSAAVGGKTGGGQPILFKALRFIGHLDWLRYGVRVKLLQLFSNPHKTQPSDFEIEFFGMRYRGNLACYIDWVAYFFGAYEKQDLFLLQEILMKRPGATVIDIGANIGHHSLFLSRHCSVVHSFEPFQPVRASLEEKMRINGVKNVVVHPVALGDMDGDAEFFAPFGANTGTGSFVPAHAQDNNRSIGKLKVVNGDAYFAGLGLSRIDVIKLDVEGFEKNVLLGMRETLRKYRPTILMEYSPETRNSFRDEDEFRRILPPRYSIKKIESCRPVAVVFCSTKSALSDFDFAQPGENILLEPAAD